MIVLWILVILAGVAAIVWGAEKFAKHLGASAVRLGVSSFALALLLAGAEPEELATAVAASLRDAPGIAFGDVIGANIAICLVALGVGALVAPLPFGKRVRGYALLSVPIGVIATGFIWDGSVNRFEGVILVGMYILYVVGIWLWERKPPALGETEELEEAAEELKVEQAKGIQHWVGQDLLWVFAGLGAMVFGSVLLVEAVRQIIQVEEAQTNLGLTVVGFATAFELVVLAWSTARQGATEAALAGVVGSFAYNVTMTLGAAAIARPLKIVDASSLHFPLLFMLGSLILVILLAVPKSYLGKTAGVVLLATYLVFITIIFTTN